MPAAIRSASRPPPRTLPPRPPWRSRSPPSRGPASAADEVELSSSSPSGWKIEFDPKTVDRIAQNQQPKEVSVRITPPEKAIAGDYAPTFTVSSRGETASTQFRVQVGTSTMWGLIGLGIVGVALLIMLAAVARLGRR